MTFFARFLSATDNLVACLKKQGADMMITISVNIGLALNLALKYLVKSFSVFSIIRRYPKIYGQVLNPVV